MMMTTIFKFSLCEWGGCIAGIAGAGLVSMNNQYTGMGFALFLLSNLFWLTVSIKKRHMPIFIMNVPYVFTSINGIFNWYGVLQ